MSHEGADIRTGFVGLGDMGARMAARIAETGLPLWVYDPRAEARAQLAALGAHVAGDAREVAVCADVIGVCVVTTEQLRGVVAEMAPELTPGKTVLVHSSISPAAMRQLAASIATTGAQVLDAPVSGSRPAAEAGTLTLMVGGDPEVLDGVRVVTDCYAEAVFHTGDIGTGQAVKLANNVMLHMNHLIALEAVRLAAAQGIDESTVIRVANVSTGRSWVTETWGLIDDMLFDHPQAGTDEIFAMMSKDIWQAVVTARETATPMALTAAGSQISRQYFQEREQQLTALRSVHPTSTDAAQLAD